MRKVVFILIGFPLFKITISYAQPGTLDPSFGTGGKVTVSFQPPEDVGRKAVLQPDGKIVQTGYSYNSGETGVWLEAILKEAKDKFVQWAFVAAVG
jgi:hypothetical protein